MMTILDFISSLLRGDRCKVRMPSHHQPSAISLSSLSRSAEEPLVIFWYLSKGSATFEVKSFWYNFYSFSIVPYALLWSTKKSWYYNKRIIWRPFKGWKEVFEQLSPSWCNPGVLILTEWPFKGIAESYCVYICFSDLAGSAGEI